MSDMFYTEFLKSELGAKALGTLPLGSNYQNCLVVGSSVGCCRGSPLPWSSPFPVAYLNPPSLCYLSRLLKHLSFQPPGRDSN